MWTVPELGEIQQTLRDPSSLIGMRMRAAYHAKQLFVDLQKEGGNNGDGTDTNKAERSQKMQDIVNVLCEQVFVEEHGSLLRHEFAYVLGQMKTEQACTALENLLRKEDDCVMVRHEAAEALGAIASKRSKNVLESTRTKYEGVLNELSDTCLLALNRLNHETEGGNGKDRSNNFPVVGCACMLAPFNSVDPVEVDQAHVSLSTVELGEILLNKHIQKNTNDVVSGEKSENINSKAYQQRGDLIERYRAMFSLRNRGGEECVKQLCRALVEDTSSPLLRHEVAFVLGQLQHPSSIPALEESLSRLEEHAMVRHESAEALGAIEGTFEDWQRIESTLTRYQNDFDPAVAESCIVALDAADYWGHDIANDDDINAAIDLEEKSTAGVAGGAFGKQKHDSALVETCVIRKQILAQHFNVVQTA